MPPFGADEDGNIKSIFEIEHLRPYILFLSIQCEPVFCSVLSSLSDIFIQTECLLSLEKLSLILCMKDNSNPTPVTLCLMDSLVVGLCMWKTLKKDSLELAPM